MKIKNNSISAENKSAEATKPAPGPSETEATQVVSETAAASGEPQPSQAPAETAASATASASQTTETAPAQETPAQGAQAQGAPAEKPTDMATQLAEAEMKGYLRGRNERIEELMREPAMYERQTAPAATPDGEPSEESSRGSRSEPMILNNRRVSIWDL